MYISSVGSSTHYTVNTYMYISSVGSSTHYTVNTYMYISSVGSSTHYTVNTYMYISSVGSSTHYTVNTYMYISSVGSSTHYTVNTYMLKQKRIFLLIHYPYIKNTFLPFFNKCSCYYNYKLKSHCILHIDSRWWGVYMYTVCIYMYTLTR